MARGRRRRLPLHWGRDSDRRYWKRAAARAGLRGSLRFHHLRHTCAALLIAANVPAKAIQAHLGHSSFKITVDTCGHPNADATGLVTGARDGWRLRCPDGLVECPVDGELGIWEYYALHFI